VSLRGLEALVPGAKLNLEGVGAGEGLPCDAGGAEIGRREKREYDAREAAPLAVVEQSRSSRPSCSHFDELRGRNERSAQVWPSAEELVQPVH
jgi:hypothetical protein